MARKCPPILVEPKVYTYADKCRAATPSSHSRRRCLCTAHCIIQQLSNDTALRLLNMLSHSNCPNFSQARAQTELGRTDEAFRSCASISRTFQRAYSKPAWSLKRIGVQHRITRWSRIMALLPIASDMHRMLQKPPCANELHDLYKRSSFREWLT